MSAEQVVLMASKQWKRSTRHPQRRPRLIDREASVTHLARSLRYRVTNSRVSTALRPAASESARIDPVISTRAARRRGKPSAIAGAGGHRRETRTRRNPRGVRSWPRARACRTCLRTRASIQFQATQDPRPGAPRQARWHPRGRAVRPHPGGCLRPLICNETGELACGG